MILANGIRTIMAPWTQKKNVLCSWFVKNNRISFFFCNRLIFVLYVSGRKFDYDGKEKKWRKLEIGCQEKADRKLWQMCKSYEELWLAGWWTCARRDDTRFIIGGRRVKHKARATCLYVCTYLYVKEAYVLLTQCATWCHLIWLSRRRNSKHSFLLLHDKWYQTSVEPAQCSSPCLVVHVLKIGDDNRQTFQVIDEIRHYLIFAQLLLPRANGLYIIFLSIHLCLLCEKNPEKKLAV